MTIYWLTLRWHGTGLIRTYEYDSMLGRALAIISTSAYADIEGQGERHGED